MPPPAPNNPYEPPRYNDPFSPGPRDPFASAPRPRSARQGNPSGAVGFALSLVALAPCCGVPVAPVSLVVSLAGLRREPRTLAMAGVAISIVAVLMQLVVVGIGLFALREIGRGSASDGWELIFEQAAIEVEIDEAGKLPASLDELGLPTAQTTDPWGQPYHYEVFPDGLDYKLVSVGPDAVLGTSDDVQLHPR